MLTTKGARYPAQLNLVLCQQAFRQVNVMCEDTRRLTGANLCRYALAIERSSPDPMLSRGLAFQHPLRPTMDPRARSVAE